MMKKEFEELAGYEVTTSDYATIIEPMYMATDLSKTEFIRCISRNRFALPTKEEQLNEIRKIAEYAFNTSNLHEDYAKKAEIYGLAEAFRDRFYPGDFFEVRTDSYKLAGCTKYYPSRLIIADRKTYKTRASFTLAPSGIN